VGTGSFSKYPSTKYLAEATLRIGAGTTLSTTLMRLDREFRDVQLFMPPAATSLHSSLPLKVTVKVPSSLSISRRKLRRTARPRVLPIGYESTTMS
jgi:hypothetical protein